jgi:hypothetical protein
MSDAVWLTCTDPTEMLRLLKGKASDRRLRLLAVACCRHIWHLLSDRRSQNALDVAERFADGMATDDERHPAEVASKAATEDLYRAGHGDYAALAVANAVSADGSAAINASAAAFTAAQAADDDDDPASDTKWNDERVWQARVLRDIFGNFIHPVALDPVWLTPRIIELAQRIYDERIFDQMPSLANALEATGCDDPVILNHCRGSLPHVRGCWIVDAILGKS